MRCVALVLRYRILFGRIRPTIVNLVLSFTLGVLVCHSNRTIVLIHSRRCRTAKGSSNWNQTFPDQKQRDHVARSRRNTCSGAKGGRPEWCRFVSYFLAPNRG